jgi:zinc finger protein
VATAKIAGVLQKITMMFLGIDLPFTIVLDDPSGNSFIENPSAPEVDPNTQVHEK